jgi:hypothetical protein
VLSQERFASVIFVSFVVICSFYLLTANSLTARCKGVKSATWVIGISDLTESRSRCSLISSRMTDSPTLPSEL